jgi:hypothetical protein
MKKIRVEYSILLMYLIDIRNFNMDSVKKKRKLNTLPGKLVKVDQALDFFALLDECEKEAGGPDVDAGFHHNRTSLLNAFSRGELFSIKYINDIYDTIRELGIGCLDRYECMGSTYPCFCVIKTHNEGVECDIIWVHKRVQRRGLATKMVKEITPKITEVCLLVEDGPKFWKNFPNIEVDYASYKGKRPEIILDEENN